MWKQLVPLIFFIQFTTDALFASDSLLNTITSPVKWDGTVCLHVEMAEQKVEGLGSIYFSMTAMCLPN